MSSTKQLLLLYATDTYKLSSLLIRRVLLTKPVTLKAYQEKTRQLLLDCQKSPSSSTANYNVAAVKLLEWDRELNSMQYYGIQEYTRRWWTSKSWSFGSLFSMVGGSNSRSTLDAGGEGSNTNKKNVARVAFMITSEQRYKLSTELGYTSQDIRSFKPIEALLLLEHGVQRGQSGDEDGFRIKLQQLMEENDRLMSMQHKHHLQEKPSSVNENIAINQNTTAKQDEMKANAEQSLSPEEAQKLSAKPDVALALLSVDKDDATKYEEEDTLPSRKSENSPQKSNTIAIVDAKDESASDEVSDKILSPSKEEEAVVAKKTPPSTSSTHHTSLKRVSLVNVTSNVSEDLHMKPDVAAVLLTAHQTTDEQQQEHMIYGDDQENSHEEEDIEEDGTCWYEVVEKLPDKVPSVKNVKASDVDKNAMQQPAENATYNSGRKNEQVIALFPTKKEALECVRIKQSFRSRRSPERSNNGEENGGERFLVRRRWND